MPVSLFRERSRSFFGRLRRGWRRKRAGGLRDHAGWDKSLIQSLSRTRLPSWRQIRHLPEVLSSDDNLRLRLGALLFVAGAAILGTRFYFSHTVIAPAVGGAVIEGAVGTPRSINPIYAPSNDVDADLVRLTFSRLFTADADGELVPDLVERHEVSDDRRTYLLTLRDDARWHDGKPVTADDVSFTVALIQDPAWKSPLHLALKDVAVDQPDARTVRLTLKEPFAPFLSRLTFGILPRHVWKDVTPQGASQAEANLKPVGSGPFKFSSLKRDKRGFLMSYTLERNADYYKEAPYLKELTFQFYPDYPAAVEALKKRQVDSLSFLPRDMRAELQGAAHVLPVSLELPQYTAVFLNARNNEALKDKGVRRALALAVDKTRILFDVLAGDGRPLDGPAIPGYTELSKSPVAFRLDEAGAILDGLGWKVDPADGLRKRTVPADPKTKTPESVAPLRLTLTTVDQAESLGAATVVKNGWAALGVETVLNAVPASDIHRTVIKPRAYEALLYGQLLGSDRDPYPFWHSSQAQDPGLNLAMFADRNADDAIEKAQREADPAVRQEHYRKFLEVLADEIPAIFLYSPSYTYPLPSELKGFGGKRVASPADRFASVTGWYLETERVWR
jgi:peptide/nickel transport system substrate-binding protein